MQTFEKFSRPWDRFTVANTSYELTPCKHCQAKVVVPKEKQEKPWPLCPGCFEIYVNEGFDNDIRKQTKGKYL